MNYSSSDRLCGLREADFTRIATNGFGDPQNSYAHSMAYFRGQIYVGTSRHLLALLKLFPPKDAASMDPWPVKVPKSVEDLDLRAQIWRFDFSTSKWERSHISPMIPGRSGGEVARDLGYRGMVVFQGRSDREPALYVSALSSVSRGTGARILRSVDGVTFTPVSEPGLGNPDVSTFRSLVAFDGYLFVAPAGEGTTWNTMRAPIILRTSDPVEGRWEPACVPGFGDPTNYGIFEMEAFDDHLYAGTFNHVHGYQIWKTPATGKEPCRWTKVIERGAYRGSLNEMAMSMHPFKGALYVGSGIQNGGYDRNNDVGAAPAELIRIYPDDSWELIVGTPRHTPNGLKYPLSGLGPGFDNIFGGYLWRMTVYEEWLYASIFDWSVFLPYAHRPALQYKRLINRLGVDHLVNLEGGFDLYRSNDGERWIPVTRTGLGNPYNYGSRVFMSTSSGLFLGTANPFGPEVCARTSAGWVYIPNPDGGAEIWLGRRSSCSRGKTEPSIINISLSQNIGKGNGSIENMDGSNTESLGGRHIMLLGAADCAGNQLIARLLERGSRVRVLGTPATVRGLSQSSDLEVVDDDLADEEILARAMRGIEIVFYCGEFQSDASPFHPLTVDLHGLEMLLRVCGRAGGVKRFIFKSSLAVYGEAPNPEQWPIHEASVLGAISHHGRGNVTAEHLVQRSALDLGFEYVIVRSSICYGNGCEPAKTLIQRAMIGPRFNGGGVMPLNRQMQWIHVEDLMEGLIRASVHPNAKNETFNLAGAELASYRDIVNIIRRLADPAALPIRDPSRFWRRYFLIYDITKAQRLLDFFPRKLLQEGLTEMMVSLISATKGVRIFESLVEGTF